MAGCQDLFWVLSLRFVSFPPLVWVLSLWFGSFPTCLGPFPLFWILSCYFRCPPLAFGTFFGASPLQPSLTP